MISKGLNWPELSIRLKSLFFSNVVTQILQHGEEAICTWLAIAFILKYAFNYARRLRNLIRCINFPRLAVKVVDVTGQLFGDRCTDHTQTVCGLGHRLV